MVGIRDSVVLVTGSNRGIGRAFVEGALSRGARKVYATSRRREHMTDPRVVGIKLDVTDQLSVRDAIAGAPDVSILINNAGILTQRDLLGTSIEDVELALRTNVLGPLLVAQAFAPTLAANEPSALVNVHSIASWLGGVGAYGVSKAALWSLTNSLRVELRPFGVLVQGLHFGYTATSMTVNSTVVKNTPAEVVAACFDGLEMGSTEVLVDERTRLAKRMLSGPATDLEVGAFPS